MTALDPTRFLILTCGNPLRADDGVGPRLGAWAAERFRAEPGVRVVARQQWGPELAEEVAGAESVLFLDSSLQTAPGQIQVTPVVPEERAAGLSTHHLDAAALLGLAKDLYASLPRCAILLTVGAGSVELRQGLSHAVEAALPEACRRVEELVLAEKRDGIAKR